MRKSNIITFLSLCGVIVFVLVFMAGAKRHGKATNTTTDPAQDVTASASETAESSDSKAPAPITNDKVLFVGDSRTVGLMEYGELTGATFFCNTGMSVFHIQEATVSVPNVGEVTLTQLLDSKSYDVIYVMLGINELGYPFDNIVKKYDELVKLIAAKAPNSKIVIIANLHVTKERSDGDKYFNNNAINRLNTALSKFANGNNIFYLDGNSLFDDENGALSVAVSSDNTHLYAKHYKAWGKWILEQTAVLV